MGTNIILAYFSKNRKRGSKKDALTEDERHRLSTMAEEQEDDDSGITIKVGMTYQLAYN